MVTPSAAGPEGLPTRRVRRTRAARPEPKLEYQPGLDGLRAIAVVAVMLYHAQQNMPTSWMPGGFLGVEVFFVISGYLITLLLISEHQRTNRIDLKQFWVRRARRLLPALFALLVVTMGIVGIGGRYDDSLQEHVKDFRGMWTSAWVYVTNWFQIVAGLNYADNNGRPPLVRHLWSLAVEEQFYLVWPLVMWFVVRRFRHRLPSVGLAFLAISLGITIGTAVAYRADDIDRVNFLYLSTLTRASGLLLGAALAVFWRPWLVPHAGARNLGRRFDALALVGLAVLVLTHWKWHFLVEGEDGPRGYDLLFRGGFLVVGLATLLVILSTTHPGSFLGQKVFASQPLVWIGTRSYGLYLWHWPIFQLTRPRGDTSLLDPLDPDVPMNWLPALVLRLALTAVVTELSYRFLETPIRTGSLGRWWARNRTSRYDTRRRTLAMAGAAVVVLAAIPAVSAFNATDVLAQQAACNRDASACDFLADDGDAAGAKDPDAATTDDATDEASGSDATEATDAADDSATETDDSGGQASDDASDPAVTEATDPDSDDSTDDSSDPDSSDSATSAPATSEPDTTSGSPGTVPASPIKPLAIGDSVMLGAEQYLVEAGFRVDAKENRQFGKAVSLVQSHRAKGQVGEIVVIALATNGGITDKSVDTLMAELTDVPHVIFVTPQIAGKSWEEPNHEVLLAAADRYPNVTIVDWRDKAQDKLQYSYKVGQDNDVQSLYFWKDKIHLAPAGRRYYTQLIVEEVLRLGDA